MRSSRVTLRPGDEKTSNRLCVTTTAPLFDRFLRRLFGAVGENERSPLLDADHDPARIADALRRSPHILGARAEPRSDRVIFTTLAGTGCDLTLDDAESTSDGILPGREINEPLAAAILPARGHHHRPDPERRALRGARAQHP